MGAVIKKERVDYRRCSSFARVHFTVGGRQGAGDAVRLCGDSHGNEVRSNYLVLELGAENFPVVVLGIFFPDENLVLRESI